MSDERIKKLKAEFETEHKKGMDGLASGDLDALSEAICREREIIQKQAELIAEQQDAIATLRPSPKKPNDS